MGPGTVRAPRFRSFLSSPPAASSVALGFALALGAFAPGLVAGCAAQPADEAGVGESVQDYGTGPKLAYDEATVLFTNPACREYRYPEGKEPKTAGGETLTAKPLGAYCSKVDGAASSAQDTSPQRKLLEWIDDPEVNEIFFAYLSFSNQVVREALCRAITERSVKVTFVLDRETDLGQANQLLACEPGNQDASRKPRLELRGHDGSLGYAHDKLFAFNPYSDAPRFVLSSGNLSSGVVLHHENWTFLRVKGDTHFAGAHRCLIQGLLDHGTQKTDFRTFVDGCRRDLPVLEESDVKTFFVPGDGGRAGNVLVAGVRNAERVDLAAHRFSYNVLLRELDARLGRGEDFRLVLDDDVYWAGQGKVVGPNDEREGATAKRLLEAGVPVRFLETNHGEFLLHHNKFAVFTDERAPSQNGVFTGAGNFTGTAFSDNFENFYYVQIPHVVKAFREQYEHLYGTLATPVDRLPTEDVRPVGVEPPPAGGGGGEDE